MPGHHHRSGSLKQQNKKNKRSKSSKRSLSRAAGGKVNGRANSQKAAFAQSKADRRNKLQQKRDAKRAELLKTKRMQGVSGLPPSRVVGVISLGGSEEIEEKFRTAILEGCDKSEKTLMENPNATITAKFDVHKKDGSLTILTNSTAFRHHYENSNEIDAAVQSALDLCRVCDTIVFVVDGDEPKFNDILDMQIGGDDGASFKSSKSQRPDYDHLVSEKGDSILHAIKAQGLPSLLTVLTYTSSEDHEADFMSVKSAKSVRRAKTKRSLNLKKYVSRFANTEFGPNNDDVLEINISHLYATADMEVADEPTTTKREDIAALVRALCTKAASPPKWVAESPRPFILSDSYQYDPSTSELKICGYVRGKIPFSVHRLVHVTGVGTFGCKAIEKSQNPMARAGTAMDSTPPVVIAKASECEPLDMFATPDALDGEQNLVGFDDDDDCVDEAANDQGGAEKQKFARPAGWSDYQAAWLDAVDDVGADDAGFDHGELADELNKKSSASVATNAMDMDDANDVTAEEKRLLREQRKKEETEHQEFPDEVEVDEDENARDRYARYRSLKSFKKTHWDPKENLPESYSTIYTFSNFKATQRSVMQDMMDVADAATAMEGQFGFAAGAKAKPSEDVEMDDSSEDEDLLDGCVPSGSYVTITLERVTPVNMNEVSPKSLLVAVALLPHENKVSVLHAGLSQSAGCTVDEDLPVKSKDVLTFRCGWRTWKTRPVFSQNNLNCNKHKFERYMPKNGAFFAATFFGPVTYTPCPVLVFRQQEGKPKELCAAGSMLGADADRIVVKRIILTGYPVRVHKRHATVKYMFYNPDDVKWFKPAGLWTKHGLNGHIIQSVGEHGTMKCLFNAPIKQHDTVCLPLYKRIFPKFASETAEDGVGSENRSVKGPKQVLVVR